MIQPKTPGADFFGDHRLSDVVAIIRALEEGPRVPADLSFARSPLPEPVWPRRPDEKLTEDFWWHRCRALSFFPLAKVDSERLVAALPADAKDVDWTAVAELLRDAGYGCADAAAARAMVDVVRSSASSGDFDHLERLIDLVDLLRTEGKRLLGDWGGRRPRAVLWGVDEPRTVSAQALSRFAMSIGTTEACVETLRFLSRCSGNPRLFDTMVAGLFGLSSLAKPPLVPLLGLRGYFSYAATIPEESTGLLPIVRQEVRGRCEIMKTELQTVTHCIEDQLCTAIDEGHLYLLWGYSTLALRALLRIGERKRFRVCIVDSGLSGVGEVRQRQIARLLRQHSKNNKEWQQSSWPQFTTDAASVTGGQRPRAIISGARCCFAYGALCEKRLGDLLDFVNGDGGCEAWPGQQRQTELVLVAGRYKYFRGHIEKRFVQGWAAGPQTLHEFVPLGSVSGLVL